MKPKYGMEGFKQEKERNLISGWQCGFLLLIGKQFNLIFLVIGLNNITSEGERLCDFVCVG